MTQWLTWVGIAILVIAALVGTEAWLKRGRKRRTLAETFKFEDDDGTVPLGMEAMDQEVLEEADRRTRLSGDLLHTKARRR